ncbi:MAG TPA: hypothetical protein VIO61_01745 [Anaerolineaceae bacterium]
MKIHSWMPFLLLFLLFMLACSISVPSNTPLQTRVAGEIFGTQTAAARLAQQTTEAASTRAPTATFTPILTPTRPASLTPVNSGKIVFSNIGLWVINPDGSGLKLLSQSGSAIDDNPVWSPDSRTIAFTSSRLAKATYDIFLIDSSGSNVRPLTRKGKNASNPNWSPDGKRLVYALDSKEIYIINADGSGDEMVFRSDRAAAICPIWTPDGKGVIFFYGNSVYRLNLETRKEEKFIDTPNLACGFAWSPDYQTLAFHQVIPPSEMQIYTTTADGKNLTQITSGNGYNESPSWSPDGRRIVFGAKSPDVNEMRLFIMNADGSNITPLTTNYSVRPDWSR